jgi:hypothetical protein
MMAKPTLTAALNRVLSHLNDSGSFNAEQIGGLRQLVHALESSGVKGVLVGTNEIQHSIWKPVPYINKELEQLKDDWDAVESHKLPSNIYAETGNPKEVRDDINRPAHYTQSGIECIEAIESALSPEEYRGFLKGQVLKYLWRANHKGSEIEDHLKAGWYLDRLNGKARDDH